ncbi:MAG: DUF418 domain-containing protein [Planctomycetaceae bacterium]|nr:MAG: DUF418 domain-containing protein [Planctomycetaceae bacterium]
MNASPVDADEPHDDPGVADQEVVDAVVVDQPTTTGDRQHRAAPVSSAQRIEALDVLRGFAVLGILVVNIQAFALPSMAYMNPHAYGDLTGVNYGVWWFTHVMCDQKFMTIFSMLFGAGIVLMTSRSESRTGRSAGVHYRRMGWLILIGLLHAHLLWYGDILYLYGMCGLLVWLFRKQSIVVLFPLGLSMIAVASIIMLLGGWSMPYWDEQAVQEFAQVWSPSAETLQEELDAYRGSWWDQALPRSTAALGIQTFMLMIWGVWRAGGLMLIGMGLYRLGIFQAARSRTFYATLAVVGLVLGTAISAYGVHWNDQHGWTVETGFFFGSQWNYWGSLLSAMGMVGALMFLYLSSSHARWHKPLAAVGQMALTNYLVQTVVCTTIFYGHGFGYFGHLQRWQLAVVVVTILAIQLVYSPIWMSHFRYGPMEWLWRSLTYWKRA